MKVNKEDIKAVVTLTLIPVFKRQRQADLWKFEANLLYKASPKTKHHKCLGRWLS